MISNYNNNINITSVYKKITENQIKDYAQASGDFNPIHLNRKFAATTQFGRIIAHGMLTLAFVNEMLSRSFGKNWLMNGKLRVRFKGAAYPGDVVCSSGRFVKEKIHAGKRIVSCAISLTNHRGQELITGMATVTLPMDEEE